MAVRVAQLAISLGEKKRSNETFPVVTFVARLPTGPGVRAGYQQTYWYGRKDSCPFYRVVGRSIVLGPEVNLSAAKTASASPGDSRELFRTD